jgi:hypothetical protein
VKCLRKNFEITWRRPVKRLSNDGSWPTRFVYIAKPSVGFLNRNRTFERGMLEAHYRPEVVIPLCRQTVHMSEVDVIELINLSLGEALATVQWWVSISIGAIALTHYWQERLTVALVVVVIVLYTLFTVYTMSGFSIFAGTIGSYVVRLTEMQNLDELTVGGARYLANIKAAAPFSLVAGGICAFGLYFGVVTFLVLGYRRTRDSRE